MDTLKLIHVLRLDNKKALLRGLGEFEIAAYAAPIWAL